MTTQTEAQRLANTTPSLRGGGWGDKAAAELRRLESENESMREQNTEVDAACAKLEAANAELKREAWDWSKALEAEIAKSAAAVAAEREACALVAEQGFCFAKDGFAIADDIRARGEA